MAAVQRWSAFFTIRRLETTKRLAEKPIREARRMRALFMGRRFRRKRRERGEGSHGYGHALSAGRGGIGPATHL